VQAATPLESVLKRDRIIVASGIVGVAVLAWAYTAYRAWGMSGMDMTTDMGMSLAETWGGVDFALWAFCLWPE
jgi:predicted metal-binding membrane protein